MQNLQAVPLLSCPDVEWFDGAQSPDGTFGVLVGDEGQVARIVDGPSLSCRADVHLDGVNAADVDSTGGLAVGLDAALVRLDPAGKELWRADYPGGRVLDVAVSGDGAWVAAGGTDHLARLWDRNGHLRAVLAGHSERVASLDFRADGKVLVTGSWDGTARLWGLDVLGRDPKELDGDAAKTWGLTLAEALGAAGR